MLCTNFRLSEKSEGLRASEWQGALCLLIVDERRKDIFGAGVPINILTKDDLTRANGVEKDRFHLSEDPGPHAVFFFLCAKGWKGVGLSRVTVVVVVD